LRKKNANLYSDRRGLAGWVRAEGAAAGLRYLALFIRKMEFWQGRAGGIFVRHNREFVSYRYFQIG
jgi:hypothetical protein